MWPLEPRPKQIVRIGRFSVQRWRRSGAAWSMSAEQPLPGDAIAQPECLAEALPALLAGEQPVSTSLVVESAWLPLLLAHTGGVMWRMAAVHELIRHRLEQLHGSADWSVRADWRAGELHALGYGLAARTQAALHEAAARAGLAPGALVPALAWCAEQAGTPREGWWLCIEQDRHLIAHFQRGRMVSLHPAAAQAASSEQAWRFVHAQAVRSGMPEDQGPLHITAWSDVPLFTGERVAWSLLAQAHQQPQAMGAAS